MSFRVRRLQGYAQGNPQHAQQAALTANGTGYVQALNSMGLVLDIQPGDADTVRGGGLTSLLLALERQEFSCILKI